MDESHFRILLTQVRSAIFTICVAAIVLLMSASICAWIFDHFMAPALVSASQKMAVMNWDAFWMTIVGMIVLAAVILAITKRYKKG